MTFLMVATIGYGAGVEIWRRPEVEIFTMTIAFSGIPVMTYFFSSVTAFVLASDFDKSLRRRRMEKMMTKLYRHCIVCGFGRVGRKVVQELEATSRHYIAIDEKLEQLEAQAEKRPGLLSSMATRWATMPWSRPTSPMRRASLPSPATTAAT